MTKYTKAKLASRELIRLLSQDDYECLTYDDIIVKSWLAWFIKIYFISIDDNMKVETLLILLLVSSAYIPTILISPAYARHPCIEGTEVAFHTNASSVCLDPFELESACTPTRGSLAGNPVCSAVSNPSAIKENFPLIQNYANGTGQDLYSQGEQEVIEEGQGIPGGEQEVIEEGQGIPGGE